MYRTFLLAGLLFMTDTNLAAGDTKLLTDFSDETEDFGWYVVNDNVMGGRSRGGYQMRDTVMYFAGRTNTRGGGFSSLRTEGPRADLSAFEGIRLRVKGDGRTYIWQLRTTASYRGREVRFWAPFETVEGEWTTVDIPFDTFTPRFRGMQLRGALDTGRITGMGLMIYDGEDGDFELELDQVEAYGRKGLSADAQETDSSSSLASSHSSSSDSSDDLTSA